MRQDTPSRTAELVAFCRATELTRPEADRILDDPHAPAFLGPALRSALALFRAGGRLAHHGVALAPGLITYVVARHRFLDDALLAALAGPVEQVLVLGAGYDTRAWRFAPALAGRPVFEVDFPATSARKHRRLSTAGLDPAAATPVTIDFQTQRLEDVLSQAGFARGRPTFVIWEGVTMYLTRRAVQATLRDLSALCGPGSGLAMDLWFMVDAPDRRGTALRLTPHLLDLLGEPVTFAIHPEDVGGFVAREGWRLHDLATSDELERRYVTDARRVVPFMYAMAATRD